MDQAARGAAALKASNFAKAITEYSAAIAVQPSAVDHYIKRSTAYQRSSPPELEFALRDAEIAVVLAFKRAKRELIAQAQLRRAIALLSLERFADADFVLDIVKRFDEKEKSLAIWKKKAGDKIREAEAKDPDFVKKTLSVKERPDVDIPSTEQRDQSAEKNSYGNRTTSSHYSSTYHCKTPESNTGGQNTS